MDGYGLAVEVDGYLWHADADQLSHDHARRVELTAAGRTILTFTWRQVVDDPDRVTEAILRTYGGLVGRRAATRHTGLAGASAASRGEC